MADKKLSLTDAQQICTTLIERLEKYYSGAQNIYQRCVDFKKPGAGRKMEIQDSTCYILAYQDSNSGLTELQIADLKQKLGGLQQNLAQVIAVVSQDRQWLVNYLNQYAERVNEELECLCRAELKEWKEKQKKASFGATVTPSPQELSQKFQSLMNHAFYVWKCVEKLIKFDKEVRETKILKIEGSESMELEQLRYNLLWRLLQASFLVSSQPPLLVKNRLELSIRLLSARRELGLETPPTKVSCTVVGEETAKHFLQNPGYKADKIRFLAAELLYSASKQYVPRIFSEKVGSVDQKPKDLEFIESDHVYGVNFKRIKVSVDSRRVQGRGAEAIRRKYYLLFQTDVRIQQESGSKIFPLSALSLPFVVSVHGTQDMELWATILWDVAFSKNTGNDIPVPLRGEGSILWSKVGEALQGVFRMISNSSRGLAPSDLLYLKERFFFGKEPNGSDPLVTWSDFFQEPLLSTSSIESTAVCPCSFGFWQWFFHIADMLQERPAHRTFVKPVWEDNLIHGFVRRDDCREKLLSSQEPSFIVRFSDNQLGALSVCYRIPNTMEIEHLRPFRQKDLIEKLGFPKIIESLEQLTDVDTVYPGRSKQDIINRIPSTQTSDPEQSSYAGYEPFTITLGAAERRATRPGSNVSAVSSFTVGSPSTIAPPSGSMDFFPQMETTPPSSIFPEFNPSNDPWRFNLQNPPFLDGLSGVPPQMPNDNVLINYLECLAEMDTGLPETNNNDGIHQDLSQYFTNEPSQ